MTSASDRQTSPGPPRAGAETARPPADTELVAKGDVPTLDANFVQNTKKMKLAHRDDGDDWMTGTIKKHKTTERTGPTGQSKRAKIEFQMLNATQTAWFRLRMSEYGPKGEWALFKAVRETTGEATAARAKKAKKTVKKKTAAKKKK